MALPVFFVSLDGQGPGPSSLILVAPCIARCQALKNYVQNNDSRAQTSGHAAHSLGEPNPILCCLYIFTVSWKAGGIYIPIAVKLEKPTSLTLSGDFWKWLIAFNSKQNLYFAFLGHLGQRFHFCRKLVLEEVHVPREPWAHRFDVRGSHSPTPHPYNAFSSLLCFSVLFMNLRISYFRWKRPWKDVFGRC